MDGDCGIDTACLMLGLSQTACNRNALRQEISDFFVRALGNAVYAPIGSGVCRAECGGSGALP